jgi:xylulokinase
MNARSYVVGYDVGTSGTKAVLCDLGGNIRASAYEAHGLSQRGNGWIEQDGEALVAAVLTSTSRLLEQMGGTSSEILAVGVSGQMFNTIAVDSTGAAISPLVSWLDTRAGSQARRIAERHPPTEQFRRYGSVLTAKDIVPKILWLQDESPELARRAAAFLDCKDFVSARLTGEIATDLTGASAYYLFDIERHAWDREAITELGLVPEQLPPVRHATEVLGGMIGPAARRSGLAAGTPVVVGTGDVSGGQLGAGAARAGQAHLSLGTASYFGVSLDSVHRDPRQRLGLLCHVDPTRWLLWAEMETAGGALAWWRRTVGIQSSEDMDSLAEEVAPEAADLLFAPWLTGERVPYWDDGARGAFVGLRMDHGLAHLTRAVMEGVAYQLRLVFEYAEAFGVRATTIRVIGGGTTGRLLPQIVADVIGRPLQVVAASHSAGARGAAFLALAACGIASIDDLAGEVSIERVINVTEDDGVRRCYDERFAGFRQLHEALAAPTRSLATAEGTS